MGIHSLEDSKAGYYNSNFPKILSSDRREIHGLVDGKARYSNSNHPKILSSDKRLEIFSCNVISTLGGLVVGVLAYFKYIQPLISR